MNFVLLQFLYLYCVTFQLWSIFASETEFCRSTNSFEYLVRCVHADSWHRGLARGRYVESFGSGVHTCELQRGINYDISEHLIPYTINCFQLEDYAAAEMYINEAIHLARKYPEMYQTGIYHANLGMIYLKKGLLSEARSFCSQARLMAKESKSADGIDQANYCIEQIKATME